jgi:glycosyltransferase involved in cell wall biosynthesis
MRMAYVSADQGVPIFGCKGCSVHVQEVLRILAGLGIDIEVFSPRLEGNRPDGLESIVVYGLPRTAGLQRAAREEAALAANPNLGEALKVRGPFDLVYERYSLWSFAGVEYAHDRNIPSVLEVNAPLIEEQALHRGLSQRDAAERVAERIFAQATLLVAVSVEVANYLLRYSGTSGRVHVINNGVNPSCFRPGVTPSYPRHDGEFTVGFVGNLRPWHGLETLVEAFALFHQRNANTRLLVVGDGPIRQGLEEDLERRRLREAVQFTGAVSHDAVPALLASMNVAVAPYPQSSCFYFSPLKVYEYMALGLPVVASRIGQLAEVIQHGHTGLLCPPGEAAGFAEAFERLREDPALGKRLGQAARATVLRRHTWDRAVKRMLSLVRVANEPSNSFEELNVR